MSHYVEQNLVAMEIGLVLILLQYGEHNLVAMELEIDLVLVEESGVAKTRHGRSAT